MATISEALAIALAHHQAGRLQEAEQVCRRILATEPDHVDTLHLLAVVAIKTGRPQMAAEHLGRAIRLKGTAAEFHNSLGAAFKDLGKLDEAVACYRRAVQLQPGFAAAHNNLGTALKTQGKLDEAVACYRRALELKPDYAKAHSNLGTALQGQGKLDEAVACCRRALELNPGLAKAHNNLGTALQSQGKLDEAIACYRRALDLEPDFAEAHFNLGVAFKDQEKLQEAADSYRRALELKPDYAEAHSNLGVAFKKQEKLDRAVACFRRALQLKPDYAEAHSNLGVALHAQGKLDEALDCYRRALQVKPDYGEAYSNLGVALQGQGQLDQALACYHRALELNPDDADAHLNRAMAWLLTADWQHGWAEYEWRWRTRQLPRRKFPQPLWDGGSLAGKTILLHAEQGLGDTLQFVRYVPLVKRLGAAVIVECQKPLVPLLAMCPEIDQLVAHGAELPAFATHAPLLSLPRILQTPLDAVPAAVPYLFAASALVAPWREKFRDVPGYKIGINWRGRPGQGFWRARDIPLPLFAMLAEIPGVRLVSLQKGAGREELAEVRQQFRVVDPGDTLDQAQGAFMDTAAIMMNLDLVVTSDTAVPHLAGALGVPVWLALPQAPDWRWLLDRRDSPWYPTMRLFRQQTRGDWRAVVAEIKEALCQRLRSSS